MIDDERMQRVGRNEALYRQVNERIEDLNEAFATLTDDFAVVCECGDLDCAEQIKVSRDDYERVRANADHFIIKPGHEVPDVEQSLEEHGDYIVIKKHAGPPRRAAEEMDPRS